MKLIVFSFLFLVVSASAFVSATEPLLFIVNHPGSKPYLYFDEDKRIYRGVIPDVLSGLVKTKQLSIKFISNSRKRSEEQMYQGNADLMMLSKAWLKSKDQLHATIPVHQHRSFLYKAEAFSDDFSLKNSDAREAVCTRNFFSYPNLEPYFKNKRLTRVDSTSQLSMLRMLFKQRCGYVVMNEYNASNLINSAFFEDEILYRSKSPVSLVPLNIILRAELTDEKKILDKHIKNLQQSGELDNIIEKHTSHLKSNSIKLQ